MPFLFRTTWCSQVFIFPHICLPFLHIRLGQYIWLSQICLQTVPEASFLDNHDSPKEELKKFCLDSGWERYSTLIPRCLFWFSVLKLIIKFGRPVDRRPVTSSTKTVHEQMKIVIRTGHQHSITDTQQVLHSLLGMWSRESKQTS